MKPVLTRPDPEGPLYELRESRSGYKLIPYYVEPDGRRDLTPREAAEWLLAVQSCPGNLVIGDTRELRLQSAAEEERSA